MAGNIGIFLLLLKKNFLVRKKRWAQSLVAQILIPIALFLIAQTARLMTDNSAMHINTTTYYPIESKDIILSTVHFGTKVRYTPNTTITARLMEEVRNCLKIPDGNVSPSPDEETMISQLTRDQIDTGDHVDCIGVVFENIANPANPRRFKYKFRMGTALMKDLYDPEENGQGANIILLGSPIVPLQLCLDEAYIEFAIQNSSKLRKYTPEISIQQMPYPPYTRVDRGTQIGGETFAEIIRFIFVIILCIEISFPANEKYIGINILMIVNGVSNKLNLFSWLVSGAIFSTFYIGPIVIIMRHFQPAGVVPFLIYGNPFIVWLVLFIHCWHVLAFGYHLSSYFWKPSHGIFATFMFITIMNNIARFATGATFRHFLLYVGVICPNILLKRMFDEITVYEGKLIGTGFGNMFRTGTMNAPPEGSIGVMLIFSIIGIVFNFFMAVYIYAVRPGKYGVSQNPFFCFQNRARVQDDENKIDFEKTKPNKREFEDVPEGSLEPGIRIRGLKKMYATSWLRKSYVYALKGVSMDFYKSQITALLGHNGAGKTTMMSILSGLTSLSEGVVFIDGKNIAREPEAIKNNIGLCPQENMVFPDLTVYQQLHFFGTLKATGKNKQELEEEISILLHKVNLTEKRNFIPKQLSGGQKRRLCLAMAVIGDANVLILDEPTSGMDAESKREVWDILLKMRGEKSIIISTHDMEEADILGDRIAIMHTGRLKSYGTSMFLKRLYGEGQVEVTLSVQPWCDSIKILEGIGISAQLLSQDEGKMVFAIRMGESLPEALDRLERLKQKLGITGMSVSIITLEQVFLRVTRDESEEVDTNDPIRSSQKITGLPYLVQCAVAFFLKKITFVRKNPWTFWFSILLPCVACNMMVMAFGEEGPEEGPTKLTLETYQNARAFVKSTSTYLAHTYGVNVRQSGGSARILEDHDTSVSGALIQTSMKDIGVYRNKYIVSAEFNGTGSSMKANGFFSGTAYLGIPIAVNAISNAILKALMDDESYKIEISAQQLPSSFAIDKREDADSTVITLAIVVFLAPAIALYVTQPLQEARCGVKQLQTMTGASKIAYWFTMFFFDFVQYAISSMLLVLTFISVDKTLDTRFYGSTEISIFIQLMLLFGLSMLPFVYLASFMKRTLNATINLLSVTPLVLGFVEMILIAVEFSWDNDMYKNFRRVQSRIFQLFPFLSFTYGHGNFFATVSRNARCKRMTDELIAVSCISLDECCSRNCSNGVCSNPFPYFVKTPMVGLPSLSTSMYYMLGSFFLYFAILFLIEQQVFEKILMKIRKKNSWKTNTTGMDELVMREKATVASEINKKINRIFEDDNENVFLVHELRKFYGKQEVVKGISFRVQEGRCFGLLGVNGAGKSTTFRMLTGEELPNGGQLWLKNFNLQTDRVSYLQEMGYCPQQDAIIDSLNAWDHLYLFARIRGIPKVQVHTVVKKWINKLNLTACAAQPSGTYSGGNKRRLNIAMALIGNPSLVLMDEPTTGVDPAARRSLWNTLKTCQDSGQSIILTSHSMEECEVLCNRLVIMVKGQLVCVGASQELKQRFGAGYNIHVKLSPGRDYADVENIKRSIENNFTCSLRDENSGFLGYHITSNDVTWTSMYAVMNQLKNEYSCIEDFTVLSSTLEQLFIQFARAPEEEGAVRMNGIVSSNKWWKRRANA